MASTEQAPTPAQTAALTGFIENRLTEAGLDIHNPRSAKPGGRAARALWLAVLRQQATVNYFPTESGEGRAAVRYGAMTAWDTLIDAAQVWQDHPDYPAHLAVGWRHLPTDTAPARG